MASPVATLQERFGGILTWRREARLKPRPFKADSSRLKPFGMTINMVRRPARLEVVP
jgi:hypothetical protein